MQRLVSGRRAYHEVCETVEGHSVESVLVLERILGRWADNLQLDGAPATDILITREPDPAESGPQKTATRPRAGNRCFDLYSTFVQEGQVPI